MAGSRGKRAQLNIAVSLLCQIVTMLCGVIVPKLIIDAFGSEAYGATASIAQFLSYITLLEGGVGGVARAALYQPLAEHNIPRIGAIMGEIKRFFTMIACVFAVYVIVLACSFHALSDIQVMDWFSTFLLVVVISIATFMQYFIGISYSLLLQAAQKTYVFKTVSIVTVFVNMVLVFACIRLGCNLIVVKLVSSVVFAARPIALWLYVRKQYCLPKTKERDPDALKQKWTGLGQHIAYFLHYNTDVAVLTLCADLTTVAVYAVYHMIIYQIQNLTMSFSAGMEAVFGDLLAKKETKKLHQWFDYYETLIGGITIILFSTTAALIVEFVRLYTANAADADYVQPLFAIVLVLSAAVYCLRLPYHSATIAAGHFKQTRVAAYGEAIINIVLSVALVYAFGLVGVAVATLIATVFRWVYYVWYLSRHIVERRITLFVKSLLVHSGAFAVIYAMDAAILRAVPIRGYGQWMIFGGVFIVMATLIVVLLNAVFYRDRTWMLWQAFRAKFKRNR